MAVHQREKTKPLKIDDKVILDIEEIALEVRRERNEQGEQDRRFSISHVLSYLIRYALDNLTRDQLKDMIKNSGTSNRVFVGRGSRRGKPKDDDDADADVEEAPEVHSNDLLDALPE